MLNKPETHLFIIWSNARSQEAEIIEDIKQKFTILKIFEMSWDAKNFSDNLTSFYGTKLPKNSHKEVHCGNGKFLLIIVSDAEPLYEDRSTSKGLKNVNVNLFDAKEKYRRITGGGHKIHATNSTDETRHDMALLLGTSLEDFSKKYQKEDSKIEQISQDLPAVAGWKSIAELFYILNETIHYIVLRNFDILPQKFSSKEHGDIDLLVGNFDEVIFLTGAKKIFKEEYRVHCAIKIGAQDVLFDFRYLNDGYYDGKFEDELLKKRILNDNKIYVPEAKNHFYSLLYHALIHKAQIASDYLEKFEKLSHEIGISDYKNNNEYLKKLLDEWMVLNGFFYTKPHDKSVIFNEKNIVSQNLILLNAKSSLEKYIVFELKPNLLKLHLFTCFPVHIFSMKMRIGGLFKLDISIGKPKDL